MKLVRLVSLLAISLSVLPVTRAAEGDASFAVSPESAFSLLSTAIGEAHESILLNVYMLTNRNVAQLLADKAQRENVKVTVLLEGETFGNEILTPVKRVLDDLNLRFQQQSEGRGRFLVMTKQGGSPRRYVFDHAKYLVIDGKKVFVSSENITGSAFNNKNLTGGSRGWEIYLENAALAAELSRVFTLDTDPQYGDVIPYDRMNFNVRDPGNGQLPQRRERDVPSFAMTNGRVSSATMCASPRSLECMLDFIRSARTELRVEHLSLPQVWVDRTGQQAARPNPVVEELIAAARRGVHVRVLLNDDTAFGDDNGGTRPEEKNDVTVRYLKAQAGQARLPIEAALFDYKKVQVNYVHNKGMVADSDKVFVSSINGTENAIMNNREMAVSVTGIDAASYFGKVFDTDWKLSN